MIDRVSFSLPPTVLVKASRALNEPDSHLLAASRCASCPPLIFNVNVRLMKHRIKLVLLGGLLAMTLAQANESIVQISVLASGQMLINGQPAGLGAIEDAFKGLKGEKSAVWYYREEAQSEPSREAMAVIELVMKYGLPISMSGKPDFSDYIDQNGFSQQRKP
jgi:hypothetical protein